MKLRYQDSKHALTYEVTKWRLRKAQLAIQYSRVRNLTVRDHNSKYFHTIASINKKRNLITRVKIEDSNHCDVDQIREGIKKHIESSYKQENIPLIQLPMGVFKKIDSLTATFLDEIPNPEEIKSAVELLL